jgi:hypothetical protein
MQSGAQSASGLMLVGFESVGGLEPYAHATLWTKWIGLADR